MKPGASNGRRDAGVGSSGGSTSIGAGVPAGSALRTRYNARPRYHAAVDETGGAGLAMASTRVGRARTKSGM